MAGTIDQALHHLAEELRLHRGMMALQYQREQAKESRKTPGNGRPYTIDLQNPILPQPQALMLLPRNPLRFNVGINNLGPGDILFHTQNFDPDTILNQISDPNDSTPFPYAVHFNTPNQMVEIGILPSGQSVTLRTTSSIWAFDLGALLDSPLDALLSLVEVNYDTDTTTPLPNGHAGREWSGRSTDAYADDAGTLVKGIK